MVLDEQLKIAIRDAVESLGQPEGISTKLIAWLESSISGETNPFDEGDYSRRLELIYSEMILEKEE